MTGIRNGCLMSALIIMAAVAAGAETRPADFGRQWVRSRPFTIMALIQRNEAAIGTMYVDAGLNTLQVWKNRPDLFAWAVRQQIPWHYHLDGKRKSVEQMQDEVAHFLATYPGGEGFLVHDEPKLPEMEAVGQMIAWIKQTYPHALVYSNAYPPARERGSHAKHAGAEWLASGLYDEPAVPYSYDDYLNDYVEIVKPDVLMMDQYPFVRLPEDDPTRYYHERYFAAMSAVRKAAGRAGIPYWLYVQAFEADNYRRLPSESDLRMQVYSCLAYGATGIGYFTYDSAFKRGLLEEDFSPSPLYPLAAALNKEVAHLGSALRFLTSTDVRYVGPPITLHEGAIQGVPAGIGLYHPKSRVATHVADITIKDGGPDRNALIGFFKDDNGDSYFMIVNLAHGEGLTAEQTAMSITLTLAPSVTKLTRLSRVTGQPEDVPMNAQTVDLTLPGGTGDLFKIGDDEFPGLPEGAE